MSRAEKVLCLVLILIGMFATCATKAHAKPYRIAVIDTGFRDLPFRMTGFKLCPDGHYDFIKKSATIGQDDVGHGAFITHIIDDYAQTNEICFLIYKVIDDRIGTYDHISAALLRAYKAGAKAINMSLSYNRPDPRNYKILRAVLRRGVKIFVSAGNEGDNLNEVCKVYPVCYKGLPYGLITVGATNVYRDRAKYSNYGMKIDVYEFGDINQGARGTSFAVPRALGRYVRQLKLDKK